MTTALRLGQKVRTRLVRDLAASFNGAEAVIVVKADRVSAKNLNQLRISLQSSEANLLMVKNTLCRVAFRGMGWNDLEKVLQGTCGITPVRGDVAAACKLLAAFSKDHEGFVMGGGILQGRILQAKDLMTLAKLPSRQALLSQLAGVAQSPLRKLAFLFQGPICSFMRVLNAVTKERMKDVKGND